MFQDICILYQKYCEIQNASLFKEKLQSQHIPAQLQGADLQHEQLNKISLLNRHHTQLSYLWIKFLDTHKEHHEDCAWSP